MGSPKVLFVDDETSYLEVMVKRLTRKGLAAAGADSGPKALKILAEDPDIDVVVLDIRMPEMDGIETLKNIRGIRPGVKVILLTAHATVDTAVEGMAVGAFDYLFKPIELAELAARIAQARATDGDSGSPGEV